MRAISFVWNFPILSALVAVFAHAALSQDLNTLSAQLRSGDTETKREALSQIRNLRSEEASRIAIAALRDKNAMVRATAASSVLFLPASEAAGVLTPLLADKDEFVRREAAFALGETGVPTATTALTGSLTRDKSPEVRSAAAAALGKVGNPAAIDHLTNTLDKPAAEETELLRRAAARSIGQIAQVARSGKTTILTPQNFLPEGFKDLGGKPRADLTQQFSRAVRTLMRILQNAGEADDVRREAAYALGAIGDRSAEAVLSRYASSADVYLAEICREALLKLRSGG